MRLVIAFAMVFCATCLASGCDGGSSVEQAEQKAGAEEVESAETTAQTAAAPEQGETQNLKLGETAEIGQARQMLVTVDKGWTVGEPPNIRIQGDRLAQGETFVVFHVTIENAGQTPFTVYPVGSFSAYEGNGYKLQDANQIAEAEGRRLRMHSEGGGIFEPGQKREDLVAYRAQEGDELTLRFTPKDTPGIGSAPAGTYPHASWQVGPVAELTASETQTQDAEESAKGPQTEVRPEATGTNSAEIVQSFREAGLEVGSSFPVEQEQDPPWSVQDVPKVHKEASRFHP